MEEKKLTGRLSEQRLQTFPIQATLVNPQLDTPVHRHAFVEFALIEQGEAVHNLNSKKMQIHAGDILVIPKGATHCYRKCSSDFALVNLMFIPSAMPLSQLDTYQLSGFKLLMDQNSSTVQYPNIIRTNSSEYHLLSTLAHDILEEEEKRLPGYIFNIQGAFMVILGHLSRLLTQNCSRRQDNFIQLAKAITHLNKHLKEEMDIQYLCRISGMSRPSFQRNFLKVTGTTPLQYLIKLRLMEAANMLRMTERSILEIAMEAGFNDGNYFNRLFRQKMGMTPGQYRQKSLTDTEFRAV